jgi:hypothetical protein
VLAPARSLISSYQSSYLESMSFARTA